MFQRNVCLYLKCSKTPLQAFIPKFSQEYTRGPPLKRKRGRRGGWGKEKRGELRHGCRGKGVDAPAPVHLLANGVRQTDQLVLIDFQYQQLPQIAYERPHRQRCHGRSENRPTFASRTEKSRSVK